MNKIALFLIGKKGFSVLKNLVDSYSHIITDVVGSRDSGVDNDYYVEISDLCGRHAIKFHDRRGVNFSPSDYDGYVLAIGWRWMLPSGDKVVIIHDSILPKYRGFAPLVNCLINGEETIGATALFADKDYDKGRIIAQSSRPISYPITISDAIDVMCDIYVGLAITLVEAISNNRNLTGRLQIESDATYSLWRDDEDYWIDWSQSATQIERFIGAVGSPYAGARCLVHETIAIVYSATEVIDAQVVNRKSAIGKVIFMEENFPVVVCGHGLIKITEMKTPAGDSLIPLKKFRSRFFGIK